MNVSEALIREIVTKVLEESAGKGSKPEFEKHIDPSGIIGIKTWIYKGEILSQALRTTPRTLDTSKPYQERRERRGRRDGDRRGGFRRDGQNGFNRNGGRPQGDRPQGGFRKPAEKKEGGAQ